MSPVYAKPLPLNHLFVAQTGSLLCRGLTIRRRLMVRHRADYQSATQQVANLRYKQAVHGRGIRVEVFHGA